MIRYSFGQDLIFVILALIAALALMSQHAVVASIFFILSIAFVSYEHKIYNYVKSA